VIERLAQSGRDKLKDDGINLSDWLQSLASFWGHLYVFFFGNINTCYKSFQYLFRKINCVQQAYFCYAEDRKKNAVLF